MKNNNFEQLNKLLKTKGLIYSPMFSVDEVTNRLGKLNSIKIIYGETYDIYGQTLDSLKYYFFAELLARELRSIGFKVVVDIIIGDAHSVKNKIVSNKNQLLSIASERIDLLEKIKKTYGLKNNIILMSSLMRDKTYQENLQEISDLFSKSKEYRDIAEKTVLQNRISQEEKAGYQYVLEEVALILGYDIKIGPPRENNYDKLARLMGKRLNKNQLSGIYLKPTYPLGMKFDYFVTHPEIEEFGLTPYKAGSNKLQDHRIIIGQTNENQIKNLINNSFVAKNPILPNPVFDVYLISRMAKCLINNVAFQNDEEVINQPQELKSKAINELMDKIIKPLQN
jgi:hypothetical protein